MPRPAGDSAGRVSTRGGDRGATSSDLIPATDPGSDRRVLQRPEEFPASRST